MASRGLGPSGLLGAIVAAIVVGAPSIALSQDGEPETADLSELSLEELMAVEVDTVWSAAKHEQKIDRAPSSVTVWTAKDIRSRGWRTLADVLRATRSFDVNNDHNYEHLGVRGFGPLGDFNSRVLLLVDGHRVNNGVYDTAPIGFEFMVDLDLIERIEIVRGPGSALYGSNALFGVINVITRDGKGLEGWETGAQAGTDRSLRGRVSYGRSADGVDVVLSLSGLESDGRDRFYPEFASDPSGGHASGADFERGFQAFASVAGERWRFQSALGMRDKGLASAPYGVVFGDQGNVTRDLQGYVDLAYQLPIGESCDLSARVYLDHYYYRGKYVFGPTNYDFAYGTWGGIEATAGIDVGESHRVTVGGDVRRDFRRDMNNHDDGGTYIDTQRSSTTLGAFAQDEITLSERLWLHAGLRLDHYDTFGSSLAPRVALIWKPTDDAAWKLLYGEAFRAPNTYEYDYADGASYKGNPDLEPETIRTVELIHERELGERWSARAGVFHSRMDDLIVQVLDPNDGLYAFVNQDQVTATGLELELERRFDNGARASASYSLQRAEDEATGDRLANSPEHLLKFGFDAPLATDRWRIGIELLGMGDRRTRSGDAVGAHLVANVSLRALEIAEGLDASLTIRNLLDVDYEDPVSDAFVQESIEQDGFTAFLGLTWRF